MNRALALSMMLCIAAPSAALAQSATFSYDPPGALVAGSGKGRADMTVYVPDMRFPIEEGPAYPNSQVYGVGGASGPKGSLCDAKNFAYPWRDNFCESRQWNMPLCPAGTGHQGQDIRASDCKRDLHWAVAAADGTVTHIGSYTVYITRDNGTRFDYLHMASVQVKVGQKVKKGDRVGKVADVFDGTPTSVHLHFNIQQAVANVGMVFVPPYLSLVKSYERLLNPVVEDAGTPAPPAPSTPVAKPKPVPSQPAAPPPAEEDSGCSTSGKNRSPAGALSLLCLALLLRIGRKRSMKL